MSHIAHLFPADNADNFTFIATPADAALNSSSLGWDFQVVASNRSDGHYLVSFGPVGSRGTYAVTVNLLSPNPTPISGTPFVLDIGFGACQRESMSLLLTPGQR